MSARGHPRQEAAAGSRSSRRTHSKSIGHYVLGKTIGEGTFGKVKLGTHILTGQKVAVKVLEKERIVDVADVERVAREVYILKLIRHQNVVQLYEIIETARQLYLIMEYAAGGELFDYIVSCGRVPEQEACRFFRQILEGVEEIHNMNVVHRDLKPENLLLDEHRQIKIVDFGLSNVYQDGQLLKTACGSPCYAAPEMIAGKEYVPSLCDIWSCGVILFAMLCGYLPFEDQNTTQLYRKILAAEYTLPDFLSQSGREFISGMLTTDPRHRFTPTQIRRHPWFNLIGENILSTRVPNTQHFEEDILEELEKFGFPPEYTLRCLQMNKHNHVTTTYHLLAQKKRRFVDQIATKASTIKVSEDLQQARPAPPTEASTSPIAAAAPSPGHFSWEPGTAPRAGQRFAVTSARVRDEASPPRHATTSQQQSRWVKPQQHPVARWNLGSPVAAHVATVMDTTPRGSMSGPHLLPGATAGIGSGGSIGLTARCSQQPSPPRYVAKSPGGSTVHSAPSSARGGSTSAPSVSVQALSSSARASCPAKSQAHCSFVQTTVRSARQYRGAAGEAGGCSVPAGRRPLIEVAMAPPLSAREVPAPATAAWEASAQPLSAREAREATYHNLRTSSRPPRMILQELQRVLAVLHIQCKQVSPLMLRCQWLSLRFDLEVAPLDRLGSIHAVRARRTAGELGQYKDVCNRLLAEIRIA